MAYCSVKKSTGTTLLSPFTLTIYPNNVIDAEIRPVTEKPEHCTKSENVCIVVNRGFPKVYSTCISSLFN
jgi:hypothetical protein